MTNVNVTTKVDSMMSTLMSTKAVNVTEMRDAIDDSTRDVFEAMKVRLEEKGINYGCSESDGRFWTL